MNPQDKSCGFFHVINDIYPAMNNHATLTFKEVSNFERQSGRTLDDILFALFSEEPLEKDITDILKMAGQPHNTPPTKEEVQLAYELVMATDRNEDNE